MTGLWGFLIVAVIFGTIASVVNTAINRRGAADSKELTALRQRLAELETRVKERPQLPPHVEDEFKEVEQRVQALETIVTGADEQLERRLKEVAQQLAKQEK